MKQVSLLLLFLFLNEFSQAQFKKPTCILFMLHISTNKIEALKKQEAEEKDIASIITQDNDINRAIMSDFAMNFKFCPVYFFYDTCLEKVRKQQWNQVNFYDYESLRSKKKIEVASFDTYWIAEISYQAPSNTLPIDTVLGRASFNPNEGDEPSFSQSIYGVNLYDENYSVLEHKLGFTPIKLNTGDGIRFNKTVSCQAAKKFETKLNKFFKVEDVIEK